MVRHSGDLTMSDGGKPTDKKELPTVVWDEFLASAPPAAPKAANWYFWGDPADPSWKASLHHAKSFLLPIAVALSAVL